MNPYLDYSVHQFLAHELYRAGARLRKIEKDGQTIWIKTTAKVTLYKNQELSE